MPIAVIFGGRSCEHGVSVVTGVQLLNAIKEMSPLPVYIDESGQWRTGRELFDVKAAKSPEKLKKVFPRPGSRGLYTSRGRKIADMDAAVLCCHGMNGEDGTLQGLLELCGVPYTGSGVLASALCMDKAAFKRFAESEGIPTVPYVTYTRREFNGDIYAVADRLDGIGYPFMIKPARLGSSIGVGVARNERELVEASRTAFAFDNRVIAERLLENFRELNCAALGDERGVTVSDVEEPLGWKEFLSYEDKYSGSKALMRRRLPAEIPDDVTEEVKRLTRFVFEKAGLSGVVRVDFMLAQSGELYLNEVNTLPGSLAAYFFRRAGMRETEFVRRLVDIAERRFRDESRLTYSYSSPAVTGK